MKSVRIFAACGPKLVLSTVALCALAACGGGGGGSDSGSAQAPAPTIQTVNSNNYTTGMQEVFAADAKLQTGGGTVTSVLGVDATATPSAAQRMQSLLPLFEGRLQSASTVATGVESSLVQACAGAGNISVTANDANNNGRLDSGDTGTIVFNACNDGTSTSTGTLGMTFNTWTGNLATPQYKADVTGVYTNLRTVSAAETIVMNGTTRLVVESNYLSPATSTLTADGLTISGNVAGADYNRVYTNFRSVHSHVPDVVAGARDTISIDGGLVSSNFNGQAVQIRTGATIVTKPQVLVAGELEVTGADKSMARLTADGASKALIELDANGDGTFEAKTTAGWPLVRP
jgi:hypothetical protein